MKILCFGASNTYGYDPRSYFGSQYPAEHRWVDILARRLGCKVVNAGENGREIPRRAGELLRFDLMLTNQKPLDLLIIMLGGNDLMQGNPVDAVVKRMEHFLAHIELEKSKILLIAPPPMQRGAWVSTQNLIDDSKELSCKYKHLTSCLNIGFLDSGEWDISMTFDGVHFTEDGHNAFAEGLVNSLPLILKALPNQ